MDRHNDWLESENHFFDATASENEWNIDTPPRDDAPESDDRPSAGKGRVMLMGFHLIRV